MLLYCVLFFLHFSYALQIEDLIVDLPNGALQGRKEYSQRGITFYAFQQIPYAKPPVGELRFREPQPAEGWTGIRDATDNDKVCFQVSNTWDVNITSFQQEDCLYLNVYTPKYPSAKASLPVMFYIFGGGFSNGGNHINYFGPHYLMEHEVIVVVANYRVGPFGFLSTGDTVIPGNFGLKDQQMALRWVKENIEYFGGNPDKVTIFGQSAGGSSVSLQLMSKKSEGLFGAAIAMSGSSINPWVYQRDFKTITSRLLSNLDTNINVSASSADILRILKTFPAEDINKAALEFIWMFRLIRWLMAPSLLL
ncbi:hypothetical protein JTB14_030710 [Gonioctena quinquepunctata]|nr:hypothetical protein JTB14_030710 [Gonioctena quinquepunctata]